MADKQPYCIVPGGPDRRRPETPAPSTRPTDFAEADPVLTADQAAEAAQRCLASVDCTFCEVCQLLCPDLCITRDPVTGDILIDLDHCKGCGLCAQFCPKGAIEMVEEHKAL